MMIAFGILNSNESRVDFSKIARKAKEVDPNKEIPKKFDNKLVFANGTLKTEESIGDTFLVSGNYLSLIRKVEMYSWKETTNRGKRRKKYSYSKIWTSRPANSLKFKNPDNHFNPEKLIQNNEVQVGKAKLGNYNVDMNLLDLPEHQILAIGSGNIIKRNNFEIANSKFLFHGKGTYQNPQIGDIRVSYSVLKNPLNDVTLFGLFDQTNNQIVPYYNKRTKFYRSFIGTQEGAIKEMSEEYIFKIWLYRGLGFFLLLFSYIFFLKNVGRYLNGFVIMGKKVNTGLFILLFTVASTASVILLANVYPWGSYLVFLLFIFTIIGLFRFLKRIKRRHKEEIASIEFNENNV